MWSFVLFIRICVLIWDAWCKMSSVCLSVVRCVWDKWCMMKAARWMMWDEWCVHEWCEMSSVRWMIWMSSVRWMIWEDWWDMKYMGCCEMSVVRMVGGDEWRVMNGERWMVNDQGEEMRDWGCVVGWWVLWEEWWEVKGDLKWMWWWVFGERLVVRDEWYRIIGEWWIGWDDWLCDEYCMVVGKK